MDNAYDLLTLIAALQQRKRPNMFLWNLLVRKTVARKTAKFEVHTKKSQRDMAPFVGKYVDGEVIEREAASKKTYEPGEIKPVRKAHANELLEQQFGQTIYGGQPLEDEVDDTVSGELNWLDEKIARTEVYMLGKLATTGIVPINGKTVDRAIDYNCNPNNFAVLSGTDLFTDVNSDPTQYLKDRQLAIFEATGVWCDSVVFDPAASAAFTEHPKVKDHYKYKDSDVAQIKPELLSEGAAYVGAIPEAGLKIYMYIDWVKNPATGESKRVIPEGGMYMCKSGSIEVHYGAHAQIPYGEKKKQLFMGDRIPKYYVEGDSELLRLVAKPHLQPDDVDAWAFDIVI